MPENSFSKIAIIGLGYVGLPLSIQFARSGCSVLGLDIDQSKVESINAGKSYIKHISTKDITVQVKLGKLGASVEFSRVKEVEAVLICVPTPLNKNREPNLSFVLDTGKNIAGYLQKGTLVVLESTTYPGTTDTDLRAVLEEGSGLKAGEDFHLAYSPEREDPGNPDSQVARIPKVIGGLTEGCLKKAQDLYSMAVEKTIPVSSCRAAEATKLLENIFRCVNIALINELKRVYEAMGIDVWEVIAAAKTKPFGYMPFYPGPGLGGHCIPIDPFYLSWKAHEFNYNCRFIELSAEINSFMTEYVVNKVAEGLNELEKPINKSDILIIGVAYKADVDDDRESASYVIMNKLVNKGALINYYDPYIPQIKSKRDYPEWTGLKSIKWEEKKVKSFDIVVILTNHSKIHWEELARWANCIVDTRNAIEGKSLRTNKLIKA